MDTRPVRNVSAYHFTSWFKKSITVCHVRVNGIGLHGATIPSRYCRPALIDGVVDPSEYRAHSSAHHLWKENGPRDVGRAARFP